MAFDSELLTDEEIQMLRVLTAPGAQRLSALEMFLVDSAGWNQMVLRLFTTICEQRATLEAVKEFARGQ